MTFLRSHSWWGARMFLRLLVVMFPLFLWVPPALGEWEIDTLDQPGFCPSGLVENEMCGLGTLPRSPLTVAFCP